MITKYCHEEVHIINRKKKYIRKKKMKPLSIGTKTFIFIAIPYWVSPNMIPQYCSPTYVLIPAPWWVSSLFSPMGWPTMITMTWKGVLKCYC